MWLQQKDQRQEASAAIAVELAHGAVIDLAQLHPANEPCPMFPSSFELPNGDQVSLADAGVYVVSSSGDCGFRRKPKSSVRACWSVATVGRRDTPGGKRPRPGRALPVTGRKWRRIKTHLSTIASSRWIPEKRKNTSPVRGNNP